MKPAPFQYRRPASVAEALEMLAGEDGEVKPIAGGQSLVSLMNFRLSRPDVLVDLNPLEELQYVRVDDGTLRIGAMTRQSRIETDEVVGADWAPLAGTVPLVAHRAIRNRGTLGGSLAHADPSAELCAAGLVLDARVVARSVRGQREVSVADLFDGPFMTTLAEDELLTEVALPPLAPSAGWAFEEVTRRKGDFALVGVMALCSPGPGGTMADVRLGYLSMGPTCTRSPAAETAARGQVAGPDAFAAAADAAAESLQPSGDVQASADFRRHLAAVLTRRALAKAWERATGTDAGSGSERNGNRA